jgi:hypothetical protein
MFGNDQFTTTLLHCDGANGGTTFTDNCAGVAAHSWSRVGTQSTTDTSQFVFGTASLRAATANAQIATGYINTASSTDFDVGSGDATWDYWIQFNGTGDAGTNGISFFQKWGVVGQRSFSLAFFSGNYQFNWTTDGSTTKTTSYAASTPSTGQWYHHAWVRTAGAVKFYLNGTSLTSAGTAISTDVIFASTTALGFGGGAGGGWASTNGWLDEGRLSKGTARWTANFTTPNEPYDVPVFQRPWWWDYDTGVQQVSY